MGIKDFSKTFEPSRMVKFKDYANKTIAIDAMTEIYQASLGAKSVKALTDKDGNPTLHISTIIGRILELHKYGIKQIWVFDHTSDSGDFHNPAKNNERLKRQQKKDEAHAKLRNLEERLMQKTEKVLFSDDEEDSSTILQSNKKNNLVESKIEVGMPNITNNITINNTINNMTEQEIDIDDHNHTDEQEIADMKEQKDSLEKRTFNLGPNVINEIKLIFNYLNIRYIESPAGFEAEHIAAYLCDTEQCDAVLSADTDPIPFGSRVLLRRLTRGGVKQIYEYKLSDVCKKISPTATIKDVRKVCAILGSDFCERTPGVGPKTVLKKYKDIELTDRQKEAIKQFEKEPTEDIGVFNMTKEPFKIAGENMADFNNLFEWLVADKSFNRARLEKRFDFILKKSTSKPKQTKKKT